jgi:hypothetical protein
LISRNREHLEAAKQEIMGGQPLVLPPDAANAAAAEIGSEEELGPIDVW